MEEVKVIVKNEKDEVTNTFRTSSIQVIEFLLERGFGVEVKVHQTNKKTNDENKNN